MQHNDPAVTDVMPTGEQLAAFNNSQMQIAAEMHTVVKLMQQTQGRASVFETFRTSQTQGGISGDLHPLLGFDLSRLRFHVWTNGTTVYVGSRAQISGGYQGFRLLQNVEHEFATTAEIYYWVGDAGGADLYVRVEKDAN